MFVTKRNINSFTLSFFKEKLAKIDWGLLHTIKDPNEAYKTFLKLFSNFYEMASPKLKIKINSKTRIIPLITRGILKFSNVSKDYMKNFRRIEIL